LDAAVLFDGRAIADVDRAARRSVDAARHSLAPSLPRLTFTDQSVECQPCEDVKFSDDHCDRGIASPIANSKD
jgi:hypothetical protein